LHLVAHMFTPVDWFTLASGLLVVTTGVFGVGYGLGYLSMSGSITVVQDEHMNQIVSIVMTFIGSIGGSINLVVSKNF
jgi:hypothetical protein